jgi:hypothetical protein
MSPLKSLGLFRGFRRELRLMRLWRHIQGLFDRSAKALISARFIVKGFTGHG